MCTTDFNGLNMHVSGRTWDLIHSVSFFFKGETLTSNACGLPEVAVGSHEIATALQGDNFSDFTPLYLTLQRIRQECLAAIETDMKASPGGADNQQLITDMLIATVSARVYLKLYILLST